MVSTVFSSHAILVSKDPGRLLDEAAVVGFEEGNVLSLRSAVNINPACRALTVFHGMERSASPCQTLEDAVAVMLLWRIGSTLIADFRIFRSLGRMSRKRDERLRLKFEPIQSDLSLESLLASRHRRSDGDGWCKRVAVFFWWGRCVDTP